LALLSSLLIVVVVLACGFGFGSGGVGVGAGTKALIVVQQPGRLGKESCFFSEHNNVQYVAHSKQIENKT